MLGLERGLADLISLLVGVPMTIKESVEMRGTKCTLGDPAKQEYVSPESEHVVRALIEAGAVIFGKTNVPLHVNDFQTFNKIYGSTSNPWDVKRTPGGSSGGSAAALACHFTPIEVGSDVGGSVRIPAAFCGVYGHKATYRIIPADGSIQPKYPLEISTRGPMARCPEDLALMMKLFASSHRITVGEAFTLKLPEPRKSSLKDFKVAIWLDDPNAPVCDELQNAGKRLGEQLQTRGAYVDFTARPNFEPYSNMRTYYQLTAANRAMSFGEDSSRVTLLKYRKAQEQREKIRLAWSDFFDSFDILIVPSHSSMAFLKDEGEEPTQRRMEYNYQGEVFKAKYFKGLFWAFLTNVGYLPSTTFPCGIDETSGLPLGLNAVGKEFDDLVTIDFARLLRDELGLDYIAPPKFAKTRQANL